MTEVVAVVPFGATVEGGGGTEAGKWARQIARRLVDRFADDPDVELRPVFLVAMPEAASDAGYLVFGSTPDAKLASQYARSVEAGYALTGTYREAAGGRALEVALVDVARESPSATFSREIAPGELHLVEPALAAWLTSALAAGTAPADAAPAAANEEAYAALLEGMDSEVDATLLEKSDPAGAERAILEAATAYARALTGDPAADAAEERVLVIAAGAVEREDHRLLAPVLERVVEARPRSWRAHFMLGEMRRLAGDVTGAIVALEHADALRSLRPEDSLRLAQLHIVSGASAVASSRLRRVLRGDAEPAVKATARRLLLGVRYPELEKDLEEAGKIAVEGDPARAADAEARFERVLAAEPEIWEAHFGRGLLAWQRGDAAAADVAFARAIELNPAAADLLSEIGAAPEN
ncbi:MAG: tetratricopeptide repeat protein [Chloroflexota bacterium]|nr:tetratricopeptide repeat protein [Chloroflexota bacterium]